MTELYLILHKVRGEPAFDIATKLDIGDDEGWIIPTSGHRAYPIYFYRLDEMTHSEHLIVIPFSWPTMEQFDGWSNLPDHYPPKSSPAETKSSANDLLAQLGLPTKFHSAVVGQLKRRI